MNYCSPLYILYIRTVPTVPSALVFAIICLSVMIHCVEQGEAIFCTIHRVIYIMVGKNSHRDSSRLVLIIVMQDSRNARDTDTPHFHFVHRVAA